MEDPKSRKIGFSPHGGFTQPDADFPCGAKTMKPYPEPVHWCCKGCHKEIARLLLAQMPPSAPTVEPEQKEFEWD